MIQFRKSMFETNSSATNTFIVPKDEQCKFIKQIKYKYDYDLNTIEGRVINFYDTAKDLGMEREFIAYLESRGVELVFEKPSIDTDSVARIFKLSSINELDKVLFCENTKEVYSVQEYDRQNYDIFYVQLID